MGEGRTWEGGVCGRGIERSGRMWEVGIKWGRKGGGWEPKLEIRVFLFGLGEGGEGCGGDLGRECVNSLFLGASLWFELFCSE